MKFLLKTAPKTSCWVTLFIMFFNLEGSKNGRYQDYQDLLTWTTSPSSVQLTYYAEMEEFKRNWMENKRKNGFHQTGSGPLLHLIAKKEGEKKK